MRTQKSIITPRIAWRVAGRIAYWPERGVMGSSAYKGGLRRLLGLRRGMNVAVEYLRCGRVPPRDVDNYDLTRMRGCMNGLVDQISRNGREPLEYATQGNVAADLVALTHQFPKVEISWESNELEITTNPITLTHPAGFEQEIGPLLICVSDLAPGDCPRLHVEPLPETICSGDGYWHPHVDEGRVCLGDGGRRIEHVGERLYLFDYVMYLKALLETYNHESPYRRLDRWEYNSADYEECPECESEVEETGYCRSCGDVMCYDCLRPCKGCESDFCEEHWNPCPSCGDVYCSSCEGKLEVQYFSNGNMDSGRFCPECIKSKRCPYCGFFLVAGDCPICSASEQESEEGDDVLEEEAEAETVEVVSTAG